MPYREYENWRAFYVMYPFDDEHRYYRPAALIASVKALQPNSALKAALDWLHTQFTAQFTKHYRHANGSVNWLQIVQMNSGTACLFSL